jgi:hypothetical protein
MSIRGYPEPIETPVDPVPSTIEPLGGRLVAGSRGTVRRAIKPPIRAIASPVQTVLDPVTSLVEAPLDPVAASIGPIGRVGPNVRRAHE